MCAARHPKWLYAKTAMAEAEDTRAGSPPLSEALRAFVAEHPLERESILDLMLMASREVSPGARVLDVGAGDAPYRELFGHVRYQTSDWALSQYESAIPVDYVAPGHSLPVPDHTFDAVLFTQVLEHVPNPQAVLNELFRVLRPGGRLYLSAPFVWQVHEAPYDYFRYTASGLHSMLSEAGFRRTDITPRNDVFQTLAQLCKESAANIGRYPDGHDLEREEAAERLRRIADVIGGFVGLEVGRWFPLGYAATAVRPEPGVDGASCGAERIASRSKLGVDGSDTLVTVVGLGEMLADHKLIRAYSRLFSPAADALLFVYAPDVYVGDAEKTMAWLLQATGLRDDAPKWVVVQPTSAVTLADIVCAADMFLSSQPPYGPFADLAWVHRGNIDGVTQQ